MAIMASATTGTTSTARTIVNVMTDETVAASTMKRPIGTITKSPTPIRLHIPRVASIMDDWQFHNGEYGAVTFDALVMRFQGIAV